MHTSYSPLCLPRRVPARFPCRMAEWPLTSSLQSSPPRTHMQMTQATMSLSTVTPQGIPFRATLFYCMLVHHIPHPLPQHRGGGTGTNESCLLETKCVSIPESGFTLTISFREPNQGPIATGGRSGKMSWPSFS